MVIERGAGFQKPRHTPEKFREVGLARVTYEGDGRVVCSCGGWAYSHVRAKVLEDAIDRHIKRKHGGRGIRL